MMARKDQERMRALRQRPEVQERRSAALAADARELEDAHTLSSIRADPAMDPHPAQWSGQC